MRNLLEGDSGVAAKVISVARETKKIFPDLLDGKPMLEVLLKADDQERARSNQGVELGEIHHPYDIQAVIDFKIQNPHHSTCLETRASALVGMGFEDEEVHDVLDPLCETSLQDLLEECAQDFESVDMFYLEVVRRGDSIVGLYHIPACQVTKVREDRVNFHWIVRGDSSDKPHLIFANFGDKADFIDRLSLQEGNSGLSLGEEATRETNLIRLPENMSAAQLRKKPTEPKEAEGRDAISEVIQFRRPSAMSKDYGWPGWISAVAFIELAQMFVQMKFDFYQNRGVPELLAIFMGGKAIDKTEWAKFEAALQATIGVGNQHKTIAMDLPEVGEKEFQLHKLTQDSSREQNDSDTLDAMALSIVTAHKVPPLLAGIQIPGKLGATNELPNALKAFHTLAVAPRQRGVASRFACTLGEDPGLSGLEKKNFLPPTEEPPEMPDQQGLPIPMPKPKKRRSTGFVTILDQLDLDVMDTSARMRQTEPEAAAEGRDLKEGVKERGDQKTSRAPAEPGRVSEPGSQDPGSDS